jgi:hypothetical protein
MKLKLSYHLEGICFWMFLQIFTSGTILHPLTYECKCGTTIHSVPKKQKYIRVIKGRPYSELSRNVLQNFRTKCEIANPMCYLPLIASAASEDGPEAV